ncbi:MAG: molybdopterin-synthase adenylyltransferase MoeB [Ferruginibacter sp.]|nr:molybdopterin-synthase adenylyltransferase MoeB [Ferruginibacter sp.]
MQMIDPPALQQLLTTSDNIQLIDVREPWEHAAFNIGGRLIPLNSLFDEIATIPRDKKVIIYCEKGIRSQLAIQRLQQRFGFDNLVNLTGGMYAWRRYFPA